MTDNLPSGMNPRTNSSGSQHCLEYPFLSLFTPCFTIQNAVMLRRPQLLPSLFLNPKKEE